MSSASRRMIGDLQATDIITARKSTQGRDFKKQHGSFLPNGYAIVLKQARFRAEFEAQHGPVKILWKDGKPVS